MNKDLERERNRNNDLEKTCELANAHFIAVQDQLKLEIEQLKQKLQGAGITDSLLLMWEGNL